MLAAVSWMYTGAEAVVRCENRKTGEKEPVATRTSSPMRSFCIGTMVPERSSTVAEPGKHEPVDSDVVGDGLPPKFWPGLLELLFGRGSLTPESGDALGAGLVAEG